MPPPTFIPLARMWDRVAAGKADSDTTAFTYLMYAGEMVCKVATIGLVSAVADDKDGTRHSLWCSLVRASSLGDWISVADNVLVGPASQHLLEEARQEQRELTQKFGLGQWQYEAVVRLHQALTIIDKTAEPLPTKVDGRTWMRLFVRLRNKGRAHGALGTAELGATCPLVEESIQKFTEGFLIFKREWAHLHRNLSGKYRVTSLGGPTPAFDHLKSTTTERLSNGVYLNLGRMARVDVAQSDVDAQDFLLPNGQFNGQRFELISYISGDSKFADAAPYLGPISQLPSSETHGALTLQAEGGQCFTNAPPPPADYVDRPQLEVELQSVLSNERHPVVTLVGRGGIGKTSLALAALRRVAATHRFTVIVWFSARDLDLLPQGPKPVRPDILSIKDVAEQFTRLVEPADAKADGFKAQHYLENALQSPLVGPTLFVFDNFETVSNPAEFFRWIDTNIRNPNKVLVTTRHRDFKGDYPITVLGMTENESDQLIDTAAKKLGIGGLITRDYRQELARESDGHPYVIKIMLGEVAKAKRLVKVERIVADADQMLTALFERTYAMLTPAAQRVFLTLCSWRATVPQLALVAVLLRPANEKFAVGDALDELERSSFVEVIESEIDKEVFATTPLAAMLFGRKKLAVSPMKSAIEADMEYLHQFGAGQRSDVRHGFAPYARRLFSTISKKLSTGTAKLTDYLPILESIAIKRPLTWLDIATLHEEASNWEPAKQALRRYLEVAAPSESLDAWRRLSDLCRRTRDFTGEVHALVELSDLSEAPFEDISRSANRFNNLLVGNPIESEEKRILAQRLVTVMEQRVNEADATALSRLAWICLHLGDAPRALRHVSAGLSLDQGNEHCVRLATRLKEGASIWVPSKAHGYKDVDAD